MEKLFKCSVCGYIHEGDDAPDFCPKCGSPKEKFVELSEADAEKVRMSARTNQIHMELVLLADQIIDLCEEGIEIDLDPPCVDLFEKSIKQAVIMRQMAIAEMEGHMKKGKW